MSSSDLTKHSTNTLDAQQLQQAEARLDETLLLLDKIYALLKPVLPFIVPLVFVGRTFFFVSRNLLLVLTSLGVFLLCVVIAVLIGVFQPPLLVEPLQQIAMFIPVLPWDHPLTWGIIAAVILMFVLQTVNVFTVNNLTGQEVIILNISKMGDPPGRLSEKMMQLGFIMLPDVLSALVERINRIVNHPLILFFGRDMLLSTPFGALIGENLDKDTEHSYYIYSPIILAALSKSKDTFVQWFGFHDLVEMVNQTQTPDKKAAFGLWWKIEFVLLHLFTLSIRFAYVRVSSTQVKLVGPPLWIRRFKAELEPVVG
jgi:hypothetical protein